MSDCWGVGGAFTCSQRFLQFSLMQTRTSRNVQRDSKCVHPDTSIIRCEMNTAGFFLASVDKNVHKRRNPQEAEVQAFGLKPRGGGCPLVTADSFT